MMWCLSLRLRGCGHESYRCMQIIAVGEGTALLVALLSPATKHFPTCVRCVDYSP
jgi:hypothetical protein